MKKAIYTLFLSIFIACFLTGCGATPQLNQIVENNAYHIFRKTNEDGSIFLSYVFPVNIDVFDETFTENEKNVYLFYLTTYVNALAKTSRDKSDADVIVENCKYYTDIDGIGFTIIFKNLQEQKTFFGAGDDNSSQQTQTHISGIFVKKISFETQFPISNTTSANNLKAVSLLAIASWAKDCEIGKEKQNKLTNKISQAKFVYDFAVCGKGLDSDCMYQENGYSHNVFCKSMEEIEENPNITFFVKEVNRGIFYFLAVVSVCGGVVLSLLIIKRKEKGKKK